MEPREREFKAEPRDLQTEVESCAQRSKMQPGNLPHKARMVLERPEVELKSWREPAGRLKLRS